MTSMFEGNQFMFLVLIALVISGALRVGLELRDPPSPRNSKALRSDARSKDSGGAEAAAAAAAAALAAAQEQTANSKAPASLPQRKTLTAPSIGSGHGPCLRAFSNGLFPPETTVDPNKFKFRIKLLASDRADSIVRSLESLAGADYGTDKVDVDIFVDHTFSGDPAKWNGGAAESIGVAPLAAETGRVRVEARGEGSFTERRTTGFSRSGWRRGGRTR